MSQSLREPPNKVTPAIARLKSSCSTPIASSSFIANLTTPETPYGQIFCDKDQPVSPETRKRWKKYVYNITIILLKYFSYYTSVNFYHNI